MRLSAFCLSSLVIASFVLSCGPPPGGEPAPVASQQPGIAANTNGLPELQKKLGEINQRISEGQQEDQELTAKIDDLRTQRDAAEAVLQAIQSNTQNEISQRTDAYASQDVQVQSQQLDLQIVRSQLESQIQN